MTRDTLGIYIHIPFCVSKCGYCDFNSGADSFQRVGEYVDFLRRELSLYSDLISKSRLDTIFIGGGTPTAIEPSYIESILSQIFAINRGTGDLEVTIEGNPDDYTPERTRSYLEMGVNRFSMGVQSFEKDQLEGIGRRCPSKSIEDIVAGMKGAGAKNISVDMMFGLPNQTRESSKSDIERALALGVEHISLYSLKIEEGTPLYEEESRGQIELPDEDHEREMYHRAIDLLETRGYSQYEISNFSLAERESKHNLRYWELRPYIGLGLSSSSNIVGARYKNVDRFEEYASLIGRGKKPVDLDSVEEIDGDMEIAEYMILGLRLNRGVSVGAFSKRFKQDLMGIYGEVLDKYAQSGMVSLEGDRIVLTQKGRDLSNTIFCELLPD